MTMMRLRMGMEDGGVDLDYLVRRKGVLLFFVRVWWCFDTLQHIAAFGRFLV